MKKLEVKRKVKGEKLEVQVAKIRYEGEKEKHIYVYFVDCPQFLPEETFLGIAFEDLSALL